MPVITCGIANANLPLVHAEQAAEYRWRSFDLVFSADVLEHVHEDEAERVIAELVRVSRRHLFLSISLKPHTKVFNKIHPAAAVQHALQSGMQKDLLFKRQGSI